MNANQNGVRALPYLRREPHFKEANTECSAHLTTSSLCLGAMALRMSNKHVKRCHVAECGFCIPYSVTLFSSPCPKVSRNLHCRRIK